MKTYHGKNERTCEGGVLVFYTNEMGSAFTLSPARSQRIINHSPDGFNWGYGGSGPAQLALALLLDVTGDKNLALAHYQKFKGLVIAGLGEQWELKEEDILRWVRGQA